MIVQIPEVVFEPRVRGLCVRPYPGHPRGCPNYGKKRGCPPGCPTIHQQLDLARPVYAIVNEFDLAAHVARMRTLHPAWSQRQLECCLYWQPRARLELKHEIKRFLLLTMGCDPSAFADTCPEAGGVNVTQTLARVGIDLEWPPKKIVRQVAFGGFRPVSRGPSPVSRNEAA